MAKKKKDNDKITGKRIGVRKNGGRTNKIEAIEIDAGKSGCLLSKSSFTKPIERPI
jgi:hypothetical protein